MININEYFNFLYKLERTGMKYDLSNITKICNHLGNPQNSFKTIHIAGTNGKGATASFAASILMEHGFKTGLFTSPHILEFNERIRINSKCISDKYIKDFLDNNIKIIKKIKPSFFEVNTAMAFKYFADKKVDAAVIECGLGGRLDSTNILHPDVSVITQIDMDHMQFLGNTLSSIAREKLGIVKPGIKVVVSDNNKKLKKLIHTYVKSSDLIYLDDIAHIETTLNKSGKPEFSLRYNKGDVLSISSPLPGNFQPRNISAGCFAAIEYMGKNNHPISIAALKRGVRNVKKNTGYFGRFEFVAADRKKYLLDVSHNPDGIRNTLNSLTCTGFKNDVIIFGIMGDKDYRNSLKEILKHSLNIILTKPDYERALEPGILYNTAKKMLESKNINIMIAESVKDSLRIADKLNYKKIIVIGSFFLVSDALKALGYKKLPY